uniref:HAT C-terminal dimerisation domain-containing protein n=1 Tax=Amphimedon queenslandica TaxID=400682 RepID=A0A1X7TUN9_AMPQE
MKCHFYFSILDKFLAELSNRFDEKKVVIMDGVSSCTPTSSIFLSFNYLKAFAEEYGIGTDTLEVECRLLKIHFSQFHPDVTSLADLGSYLLMRLPAHPTICELVRIALTIAVTSAKSERFFSTMKRIKSRLRTRMTEDTLSDIH